MQTGDGKWTVHVGGLGGVSKVQWFRLVGPGVDRALPSMDALLKAVADLGFDLAQLHDHA
jgi:hypothetical protein